MDASPSVVAAREKVTFALLSARNAQGHWTGELSSSALATATAVCALSVVARHSAEPPCELLAAIDAGLGWLAANRNADGGWGDTDRSFSNLSTTALAWAAFGFAAGECHRATVEAAENWLRARTSLEPEALAKALAARYGKDRTFSVPILTMCAIAGRLGAGKAAWHHVTQLPFELAALPARWFGAMRLPVVSYALPALIAIGQVRHHFRPTRNPLACWIRDAAQATTLRVLARIQPPNGGFLEATPLTAFVTMSLAAMGLGRHPVGTRGVEFLLRAVRPDGSWAIDTNLATWLTTLAVNALGDDLPAAGRQPVREWLLGQQYRAVHPYTNAAPGGWAWTDLPGGVPDSDDTAGALLALRRLGPLDEATRQAATNGARWLADLQNGDGGIPTFCRGWGALPFDRSSPDITAHALRAWAEWLDDLPPALARRVRHAMDRALGFLARNQRQDGAWIPLWFGHQEAADDENPLYGTTRVLVALRELGALGGWPHAASLAASAERWLMGNQNSDGGWAGILGAASSVEETALALEALPPGAQAQKGIAWLTARVQVGDWQNASPIGFYFARLWYYERLYPAIFASAAFRITKCSGDPKTSSF